MSVYVIIHERRGGERRLALVCRGRNRSLMQFYLRNKNTRVIHFLPLPTRSAAVPAQHSTWLFFLGATESAKDSSLFK